MRFRRPLGNVPLLEVNATGRGITPDTAILGRNKAYQNSWKYITMPWFHMMLVWRQRWVIVVACQTRKETNGDTWHKRMAGLQGTGFSLEAKGWALCLWSFGMSYVDLRWSETICIGLLRRFIQSKMVIRMPCLSSASKPKKSLFECITCRFRWMDRCGCKVLRWLQICSRPDQQDSRCNQCVIDLKDTRHATKQGCFTCFRSNCTGTLSKRF